MAGFVKVYNYDDVPTIREFNESNHFYRLLTGPFGCVRGDELIATEEGLLPISLINRPMRVLSWNEKTNQFQFSPSGGAFPKGRDYLYQILTPQGESVVAGHHRVFCGGNTYLPARNLLQGDTVPLCSCVRSEICSLLNQKSSRADDLRYEKTTLRSLGYYAALARQYGQRLLSGVDICPAFAPELAGAQTWSQLHDPFSSEYMDDLPGLLSEHIHRGLFFGQTRTDGYWPHVENQYADGGGYSGSLFFGRIACLYQRFLRLLRMFSCRRTKRLLPESHHSSSSPLSMWPILSVKKLGVKEVFWDMQVAGTNNYVTANGMIHHNSGKSSGCVAEIIDRGIHQTPMSDGVRRTRWAVIRNVYRQLLDTTMNTVFQWLPPEHFGRYNVSNYEYTIDKIPLDDGTSVEIEILFRALDKEEHVRNLLSLELTGAWMNELREIPKVISDAVEGRTKRYPSVQDGGFTWSGVIADTNPPDTDSWIYKLFEEQVPKDPELASKYKIFKQPSGRSDKAENTKYLSKDYYTELAIGKDPEYIKVYIDGEYGYVRDGKPVFPNYTDTLHYSEKEIPLIKGYPVVIGFDFGLTPAAAVVQLTPKGQLHIVKEMISEDMGLRRFVQEILRPYMFNNLRGFEIVIVGDPAGVRRNDTDERSCFDELKLLGLPVVPAPTNSFLARYNAIDVYLTKVVDGKGAFQVSQGCEVIRKGLLGEYKLKRIRGLDDKYSEVPVKNMYSHIIDAMMYAAMLVDRADMIARSYSHMGSRYAPPGNSARPNMSAWT